METVDRVIDRLACHGVVERNRLLRAGVTDHEIATRVTNGSLRVLHPGVYLTFGSRLGYDVRLVAACLAAGPGAVVSHRAALWLWDILDGEQPVELTAPRSSHPVPRHVTLHRPLDLRPIDVVRHSGVPVTNPMRTLLDAGAVLPRIEVGRCVELALKERLVSVRGLRMILHELGRRGRTGTGTLRGYLDRRALGDKRPESMLEPLMARLLIPDLGVGPILYQHRLELSGQVVRPDFFVVLADLAVEIDGLDAHGSREALDRDHRRTRLLKAHGYEILPFTATDLRRPAQVAKEVTAVAKQRIQLLGRSVAV